MKKQGIASPITKRGTIRVENEAELSKVENQYAVPANTRNAKVTTARRSSLCMFLPRIGAIRNASTPTGAVASPAHVAV